MQKNEREQFATLILGIGEYYRETVTPLSIEIYWSALKDRDLAEIDDAIRTHVKDPEHGHYMPKAADILRYCSSTHASGLIAWAEVIDAMGAHGAYCTVMFSDGVTNAVIRDLGGWPQVCHRQVTDENEIWLQKEFVARYEEYSQAGRYYKDPLLGLHASNNIEKGYLSLANVEPVYIETSQRIPRKQIAAESRKALPEATDPDDEPRDINKLVAGVLEVMKP